MERKQSKSRWIGVALAMMLIAFACPLAAFASTEATISVGSVEGAKPGQEVSVPVEIKDNPGAMAGLFELEYDHDALELVGSDVNGALAQSTIPDAEANDKVGFLDLSAISEPEGVLFNVRFKVKEGAKDGTYDVKIGLSNGVDSNFTSSSGEAIPVSFSAGKVTVSSSGEGVSPGSTDTSGSIGDQTPVTVKVLGSDGDTRDVLMRGSVFDAEYSLDGGKTWQAVPEDGIVTAEDGKTIALYGGGDADYVLESTAEAAAAAGDSEEGLEGGSSSEAVDEAAAADKEAGGAPKNLWLIIGIAVVVVVVVIVLLRVRRPAAKG